MSACNVLIKKKSVHMLVDGLSYGADGVIVEILQKCTALPTLHAAISTMGAGAARPVFSVGFSERFSTFDELVDGAEGEVPLLFDRYRDIFDRCGFSDCQIFIAGWSGSRDQPEAYAMMVCDPASEEHWKATYAAAESEYSAAPFKLQALDNIVGNPPPSLEQFRAAGMRFDCDPEKVGEAMSPEVDLLQLMEIQRRIKAPLRPGCDPFYWVGGLALLTSIDRVGISQRVLHRWEEDQVGEIVTPQPIDWKAWRASRTVASAAIPEGLSRLQRERMEKKARKGTLRAV